MISKIVAMVEISLVKVLLETAGKLTESAIAARMGSACVEAWRGMTGKSDQLTVGAAVLPTRYVKMWLETMVPLNPYLDHARALTMLVSALETISPKSALLAGPATTAAQESAEMENIRPTILLEASPAAPMPPALPLLLPVQLFATAMSIVMLPGNVLPFGSRLQVNPPRLRPSRASNLARGRLQVRGRGPV